MIFGAELPRLLLCPALLLCLLAMAAPAWAQPVSPSAWGLPQLMQSLAQTRAATGNFTEREISPVLSAPLISTGTLTYVAPDYVRKVTNTPAPEIFILDHGQVTLTSPTSDGTRVFTLHQDPRIAGLVEGIRATLAGDLPALEQYYIVTVSGSAADWQLHLAPKDASLQRFLRAMSVSGAGGRIASIDTASADGSESIMTISAATVQNAP
jgi:outer membrane lipoprotein-sorting protein